MKKENIEMTLLIIIAITLFFVFLSIFGIGLELFFLTIGIFILENYVVKIISNRYDKKTISIIKNTSEDMESNLQNFYAGQCYIIQEDLE